MSVDKVQSQKRGRAKPGAEITPTFRVRERRSQQRRSRHSQEGRKRAWRRCAMEGDGRQSFKNAAKRPSKMRTHSVCWNGSTEFSFRGTMGQKKLELI